MILFKKLLNLGKIRKSFQTTNTTLFD